MNMPADEDIRPINLLAALEVALLVLMKDKANDLEFWGRLERMAAMYQSLMETSKDDQTRFDANQLLDRLDLWRQIVGQEGSIPAHLPPGWPGKGLD